MTLTGHGDPVQLSTARVAPNFFDVLGERRFGSGRALLGKSITLAQTPYTVIDVAPRGFAVPD